MELKNFKELMLSSIFEPIRGKRLTEEDRIQGDLPFITAGENNNGITDFIGNEVERFENKLTIDMFGNCFFHPYTFSCDDNILVLNPREYNFSKDVNLFFATLLNQERFRYRYGRQYRQKDFKKQVIKLPFTDDNVLDIVFIENFMKDFRLRERENYFAGAKLSLKSDFNKNWQEFKMIDIFEQIIRGKRLKSEDREHDTSQKQTLYFSASELDNGLTDTISNPLFIEKNALIYTTFGDCFYVEGEFSTSDEINIFKHSQMDKYSALFIATIIAQNKYRYRFGRKAFFNKFENEIIKLPAKQENGKFKPDFAFMSDYIKNLKYSEFI